MLTGQKIESQNVNMMSREQSQIKLEHNTELNEEQYQQQEYMQSDQVQSFFTIQFYLSSHHF